MNKGGFVLKFIEEFDYDMNFNEPRIIIKNKMCIVENVKSVVMIGDKSITVKTKQKYVTVIAENFVISEMKEGRLLIEGEIQGVQLLRTSGENKD